MDSNAYFDDAKKKLYNRPIYTQNCNFSKYFLCILFLSVYLEYMCYKRNPEYTFQFYYIKDNLNETEVIPE